MKDGRQKTRQRQRQWQLLCHSHSI
jgi:hypothetical protein